MRENQGNQSLHHCINVSNVGERVSKEPGRIKYVIGECAGDLKESIDTYVGLFVDLFLGKEMKDKDLEKLKTLWYEMKMMDKDKLKDIIQKAYKGYKGNMVVKMRQARENNEEGKINDDEIQKLREKELLFDRVFWKDIDNFIALVDHLLEGKSISSFIVYGLEDERTLSKTPERMMIFREWRSQNITNISEEIKNKIVRQAEQDRREKRIVYDGKMTGINIEGYKYRIGGNEGIPENHDMDQKRQWIYNDKYINFSACDTRDGRKQHSIQLNGMEKSNVEEWTNAAALWILKQNPGARFESREERELLLEALGKHIGLEDDEDKVAAMMYYTAKSYCNITKDRNDIGAAFGSFCFEKNRSGTGWSKECSNYYLSLIKDWE